MKKLIFSLLALLNCALVRGDTFCLCGYNIQPYIGIQGGVNPLSGRYRVEDATEKHTTKMGTTSGLLGATLGAYTYFSDRVFFGIQGNALYNSLHNNVITDTNAVGISNHIVTLTNHFQWGFDARLGYAICSATPYILAGIEISNWTMLLKNGSDVTTFGVPPGSELRFSKTLSGPKVGGGVTFPIACCINANFEYSYTWFGNIDAELIDPLTTADFRYKTRVQQSSFLIGVNYLF